MTSLDTLLISIKRRLSIAQVLLGGFLGLLAWAMMFEIDETVRAQGVVVASDHSQLIQVSDGGVLSKLLVSEGELVNAGQLLATLDKSRIDAAYQEIRSQVAYLRASLARAQAELSNSIPVFDSLSYEYPELIKAETNLYHSQQQSLREKTQALNAMLALAQQELKMVISLEKTGDVSQLELLQAKQKVLDLEQRIAEIKNQYQEQHSLEVETLEAQLIKATHQLSQHEDLLQHTNVYAPVTGIIKTINLTTIGGVLGPGGQLMEISPTQGGYLLEAKISPVDIGRIRIDMPVTIKLDAFDYAIFGALKGKVIHISSDTLLDNTQPAQQSGYYQVNIELLGAEHLDNQKSKEIQAKLGMSATVDIKVSQRSLFTYLIKPVTRGFSGALNEQ